MNSSKITNLENLYKDLNSFQLTFVDNTDGLKDIINQITSILDEQYAPRFTTLNFVIFDEICPFQYLDDDSFAIAYALLDDQLFKWKYKKETKLDLELLKLLNAREENINFELELGEIICGDNTLFPYRSSYYLTQFFNELGFSFVHNKETRRFWVQNQLKKCNIHSIYKIITQGIFLRKHFINTEWDIENAKEEFKRFIEDSIRAKETVDLSGLFNINVKNELLFNKEINTEDETLNDLIETSRKLFIKSEKQLAIEKLWDAFERLKTYLSSHKKQSADEMCSLLGKNLDKKYFDNEYKILTEIGNTYQIRHFEKEKIPINDIQIIEYLYFRLLSLIDISVSKLTVYKDENIVI